MADEQHQWAPAASLPQQAHVAHHICFAARVKSAWISAASAGLSQSQRADSSVLQSMGQTCALLCCEASCISILEGNLHAAAIDEPEKVPEGHMCSFI